MDAVSGEDTGRTVPIVAIGASAGGIEALCALVSDLGTGTGACYVVIQHLAPDKESLLHELLGARSALDVEQIEDGEPVRPDRIVLVPPGKVARLDESGFVLTPRDPTDPVFRPIDQFFASLAEERGREAYCVVLSGTGTDGTAGLREVKAAGGFAIVQEREGARFPGMPDSAVATGMVDLVLPVKDIADRLQEILYHRAQLRRDAADGELRDRIEDALPRITRRLADVTGHDFGEYKPGTMIRRIERRMVLERTNDVERFVRTLESEDEHARILGQEFLIGVTRFFRDPEAFDVLREKAIGPLLDRVGRSVRVWVPGCSTGEEPYSIAMLFIEEMQRRGDRRPLQVFGTDIDVHALLAARYGEFRAASFEEMDPARREAFFQPTGDGYRARPELREVCVFAPHNLLQDPPFSRLDLISCRNMLIYLKPSMQQRIFPRFHFSLRPGGMLLLGPSEGLTGNEELFQTVDKTHRLFRRNDEREAAYSPLAEFPRRATLPPVALRESARPAADPHVESSREALAESAFLREHAAPFAVVSERGEVQYLSSAMTAFVRPAPGAPSNAIDTYLAAPLRVPVRSALADSARGGESVRVESVLVDADGAQRMYDVLVAPLPGGAGDHLLTLQEVRSADATAIDDAVQGRDITDRHILEQENVRLRRQLAATLNEHETSGQELKSTNEELMSMNEELQSSNEELETSREELQSINEELETVNAELRENNRQLVRANSDLKNLFESTDVAVLFLDRSFSVRNVHPRDLGALRHPRARRGPPDLRPGERGSTTRSCATTPPRSTRRSRSSSARSASSATDETFLLRIKPYRTTDNRIDGYVLSFFDITNRKRAEETLRRNERDLARQYAELENLYDTTPIGLSLIDRQFRYIRINAKLAEINGVSVEDHVGKSFTDLLPDIAEEMEQTYQHVFDTGEPVLGQAVEAEFEHTPGERRQFITDLYPVYADGQVFAVGTCVREVSHERRLIAELAENEARMKRLFDAAPLYIATLEEPDHVITYANPLYERLLPGRELTGQPLPDAIPEVAGPEVMAQLNRVFETGEPADIPAFEVAFDDAVGGPGGGSGGEPGDESRPASLWFELGIEAVHDHAGKIAGLVTFAYDVTEQVAARHKIERQNAHQRLLLGELQHRVKNTLATVRAISRMLLVGAPDAQTFQERLSARLSAIARTHDLLTDADWTTVPFEQIVRAEARPYENGHGVRVELSGDALVLSSRQAASLGMATHELMTNAAKHGALSDPAGRVDVAVEVADGHARIRWVESGGPPGRAAGGGPQGVRDGRARTGARQRPRRGGRGRLRAGRPALRHLLRGGRVVSGAAELLLVEDEAFIAIETEMALAERGQGPIRVCSNAESALAWLDETTPRAALLDFNLGRGSTSEPIAMALLERGVPLAFLTGYTEATMSLPPPLADAPRFSKPFHAEEVIEWLESV